MTVKKESYREKIKKNNRYFPSLMDNFPSCKHRRHLTDLKKSQLKNAQIFCAYIGLENPHSVHVHKLENPFSLSCPYLVKMDPFWKCPFFDPKTHVS